VKHIASFIKGVTFLSLKIKQAGKIVKQNANRAVGTTSCRESAAPPPAGVRTSGNDGSPPAFDKLLVTRFDCVHPFVCALKCLFGIGRVRRDRG
jgi:hypothetical protein